MDLVSNSICQQCSLKQSITSKIRQHHFNSGILKFLKLQISWYREIKIYQMQWGGEETHVKETVE